MATAREIVRAMPRPIVAAAGVPRMKRGLFNVLSLLTAPSDFWYDPTDYSTMFQDVAGTTPVTAAAQAVRLMLDKSKGAVRGPDLVVNGGFDSAANWSLVQPTAGATSIGGGTLRLNTTDGTVAAADQLGILTLDRTYEVTLDVVAITGAGIRVDVGGVAGPLITTTGPKRLITRATANTNLRIVRNSAATDATVDNVTCREIAGNHFQHATGCLSKQDGSGINCLSFNGTTHILGTPGNVDFSAADKVMVSMGVRKLSDATLALLLELSPDSGTNIGAFSFLAPSGNATANYRWRSRGTTIADANYTNAAVAAPHSAVLTGIGSIPDDVSILRVNGVQVATTPTDQGTAGTYRAYPMQLGGRAAGFRFNGDVYQIMGRAGDFDARLEAMVAEKMGIVLP